MPEHQHHSQTQSRRRFIRNGLSLGLGFYIVPRHVLGGKGFIAPSDQLRIAGIGVGGQSPGGCGRYTAERGTPESSAIYATLETLFCACIVVQT